MLTLGAEKRDVSVTPANVRRAGSIPAVVYGGKQKSMAIVVDARAFEKVLKEAGEATIVSLSGLGAALPTLIHEVDFDPITSKPRHIDFYAVTKGEKVQVAIPIEFIGVSAAVENGANLVKVLHEIEVEADPMNLPHSFTVDLALLVEKNDQIHVKDLAIPSGVTLMVSADDVIALAQEVAAERVEEPSADIASIEVEKKGKEEAEAAE